MRHDGLDRGARDELFMPLAQMPFGSMTFVIRTAGEASALLQPVRETIWSVNPDQTIYRIVTLDELVRTTVTPRRFAMAVIIGFAGIALLLSIAGVYSVLNATMAARLREVGLRVALGASRRDILGLVLRRGLIMAGLGLVVGLAGSVAASQLLRSFLFGVTPADPVAITGAAAVMLLAALMAAYLPARRAAAANPIDVLRANESRRAVLRPRRGRFVGAAIAASFVTHQHAAVIPMTRNDAVLLEPEQRSSNRLTAWLTRLDGVRLTIPLAARRTDTHARGLVRRPRAARIIRAEVSVATPEPTTQNITVRLDRRTVRKAKVLAAKRNTSISGLLAEQIETLVGEDDAYEQAQRRALALLDQGFHFGGRIESTRDEWHER